MNMAKSSLPEDQQPPVHQIPTYIRDNSENFEIANVVIGIATVIVALLALSKTWKVWKGWRNKNKAVGFH